MEDVHPTETAGDGRRLRDYKHRGKNEPSNTLWIRCPHCGMRNKTGRDNPSNPNGEGVKYVDTLVSLATGGTKTVREPVRVSGCLFCKHDFTQSTYKKRLFSVTNLQGR